MHLEIRDGRKKVCQVEIPKVDKQEVAIDCVIPPAKAFWLKNSGQIVVYHPSMLGKSKLLIADQYINEGIATKFFRAKLATNPETVREKMLSIKAIIFD